MKSRILSNSNLIIASFILSVFSLSGCVKIAMLVHGAHQPRQEKVEFIREFGLKKNIPIEGSAMIAEDSILYSFAKRLNEAILFDNRGYQILFNQDFNNPSCGGNIKQFITGLDTLTYAQRDSGNTLQKETGMWVKFGTKEPFEYELNPSKYDYYLAYYWNTFSGNPNHRNAVKDLRQAIETNKRIRTKLILINQDIRDGIDEEKFVRTARRYGIQAEVK